MNNKIIYIELELIYSLKTIKHSTFLMFTPFITHADKNRFNKLHEDLSS